MRAPVALADRTWHPQTSGDIPCPLHLMCITRMQNPHPWCMGDQLSNLQTSLGGLKPAGILYKCGFVVPFQFAIVQLQTNRIILQAPALHSHQRNPRATGIMPCIAMPEAQYLGSSCLFLPLVGKEFGNGSPCSISCMISKTVLVSICFSIPSFPAIRR